MRSLNPAALLAVATVALTGCNVSAPEGVEPVTGFDADRYLGRWYEIARLDHRFERGLTHVTAEYSRKPDGDIRVLNRGWHAGDGEWREAEGVARFLGAPEVASLKVSFFKPFWGGYHVAALDPDYHYSLVSGPGHAYLWILAREPRLDSAALGALLDKAATAGFDTNALIWVSHEGTPGNPDASTTR